MGAGKVLANLMQILTERKEQRGEHIPYLIYSISPYSFLFSRRILDSDFFGQPIMGSVYSAIDVTLRNTTQ